MSNLWKLVLLVVCVAAAHPAHAGSILWPDTGGSGGGGGSDNLGNHTATQDIALGLNEVEQTPAIGFNSTLTGWATGQEMSAI